MIFFIRDQVGQKMSVIFRLHLHLPVENVWSCCVFRHPTLTILQVYTSVSITKVRGSRKEWSCLFFVVGVVVRVGIK
jgi:hypothetical protein